MSSETTSLETQSALPPLPRHRLIYSDILDLIGDTPLINLGGGNAAAGACWGKLESFNPGGSIKDRICLAMIRDAEARGVLKPGGTIIEPTSGNTGIGLALVCAKRGYKCILTMPESMSLERRALLEALGAQVVLTPAEDQLNGAISRAQQLAKETPGAFMPQQFDNQANPATHVTTTAQEIITAMSGLSIDAFVAGVGTGGTISGVGRAFRDLGVGCRIIAVEPESCATISRGEVGPTKIQGLAAGFVPSNYDASVVDEVRTVRDDRAWAVKKQLGRERGLLVGISAGAAVAVARDVAQELGAGKNVVVILPDTGERYFSLGEYFP